jgi:hypothetical protein
MVEESLRHAVDALPVSPSLILASLFGSLEPLLPPADTVSVSDSQTLVWDTTLAATPRGASESYGTRLRMPFEKQVLYDATSDIAP